jgi:hypothetical protein
MAFKFKPRPMRPKLRPKPKLEGMKIALPCRATKLSASHKSALDDAFTQSAWDAGVRKGCRVIFWPKGRIAMRCEGRKLSTSAKKRFKRQVRDGDICLKKRGKRVRFSKRC